MVSVGWDRAGMDELGTGGVVVTLSDRASDEIAL
jgi:hypothetical protein